MLVFGNIIVDWEIPVETKVNTTNTVSVVGLSYIFDVGIVCPDPIETELLFILVVSGNIIVWLFVDLSFHSGN